MTPDFPRLKRRLWIGTLALDALMLAVVWLKWPAQLPYMVWGAGLGLFYLWSLIFNAEHPKRKIQLVFSLIRMALLAYIIVSVSGARIQAVAIVICGLLSYKVILTVEYVLQALPAFGWRRRTPEANPRPDSPTGT